MKKIILFLGPSGAGKGSIEELLFQDKDLNLKFSISATTRKPRKNEREGIHYFFLKKEQFQKLISEKKFIEYSLHFHNYYGTLLSEVEKIWESNKIPFLEIETTGAKNIINYFKNSDVKVIAFFITPPSLEILEQRLIQRSSETKENIKERMAKAKKEMAIKDQFDYVVENQKVYETYIKVKKIILESDAN